MEASNGLLAPGDETADGKIIQVATGSLYGAGIYLAPLFSTSDGYAFECGDGKRQLFVCLANLGRAISLKTTCPGAPCKPGFDSHIAPGFAYIPFNADQVLPCFLVTYIHANTIPAVNMNFTAAIQLRYNQQEQLMKTYKLKAPQKLPGVYMSRVPGTDDKWLLKMDHEEFQRFSYEPVKSRVKLIYLIDRSRSMVRMVVGWLVGWLKV